MKRILPAFLVLLAVPVLLKANPVQISKNDTTISLGEHLRYFDDPAAQLQPEKALQALQTREVKESHNNVPNVGFTSGCLWAYFSLTNNAPDSHMVVEVGQAIIDKLTLYTFTADGKLLRSQTLGEVYPFSQRVYYNKNFVFDIYIPTGQERLFMLRVQSGEQIVLPVQVSSPLQMMQNGRSKDTLFGLYAGIMLVMFLYNLFLFVTVRDRSYLFYVLYIFFVAVTQICLEGYGFQYFWPNQPWFASRSVYILSCCTSISSIFFLRNFLQTREYVPGIHKASLLIIGLMLVCIMATAIDVNRYTHMLTQMGIGTVPLFIIYASISVMRKGHRSATFFLVAWAILVVGIFTFVLKDAGIIPTNVFTHYTMQIGSAIEAVLLSFALADRINILKKENAESQALALETSQENERLVREQNVILEARVEERTTLLTQANEELNVTLDHLKATQTQLVDAEKMASLGQLTAGIAHEINNPINFVSSNVKPLRLDIEDIFNVIKEYEKIQPGEDVEARLKDIEALKKRLDLPYISEEIFTLLNGIEDGAKRTAEIVKGLKTFSRLDESDLKVADVHEGLDSTLVLLKNSIPPEIEIVKDYQAKRPIECYAGKLNQVFMNILNNAAQAILTKPHLNHEQITIRTWETGEYLNVSIRDTGIGMSAEVKERVFEPFFTTKDVGQGTGLGLSIVFQIIEKHAGQIKVESEINKGTEFIITLPRAQQPLTKSA